MLGLTRIGVVSRIRLRGMSLGLIASLIGTISSLDEADDLFVSCPARKTSLLPGVRAGVRADFTLHHGLPHLHDAGAVRGQAQSECGQRPVAERAHNGHQPVRQCG